MWTGHMNLGIAKHNFEIKKERKFRDTDFFLYSILYYDDYYANEREI
jgi:hypothetical protein